MLVFVNACMCVCLGYAMDVEDIIINPSINWFPIMKSVEDEHVEGIYLKCVYIYMIEYSFCLCMSFKHVCFCSSMDMYQLDSSLLINLRW